MNDEERSELIKLRGIIESIATHNTRLMHAMEKDEERYRMEMSRIEMTLDRQNHRIEELERTLNYEREWIRAKLK